MRKLEPADFVPYGLMWTDFEDAARDNPKPADFRRLGGGDWNAWVNKLTTVVANGIWPRWDDAWKGEARKHIVELTTEELPLIVEFGKRHFEAPAWPQTVHPSTHHQLFDMEDEGGWDQTLIRYCPELGPWAEAFDKVIRGALNNKASSLDLVLKRRLQRPRAHHMAFVAGGPAGYKQQQALSAFSPSMISGHCYQSMVAGFAVRFALERSDPALAKKVAAPMRRWITDIGDRRVMAGVHYPADSMASWVVVHRLAPHVFTEPDAAKRMAEAIRGSLLYGFVDEVTGRKGGGDTALGRVKAFLDEELG